MNTDWPDLIQRHMAGLLDEDEATTLQSGLKTDPELRRIYLHYMNLDVALEARAGSSATVNEMLASPFRAEPERWKSWIHWRPMMAAAAGLVIGLFSASVVFGFVVPLARNFTLMEDSFEGSTKLTSKVSLEPGIWRGSNAAIVGSEQEIRPLSGGRMLRFLNAGFDEQAKSAGDHLADVYHLLDVRSYRQELINGSDVVQVSASCNAIPFPSNEKYGCAISVYALDAETAPDGPNRIGTALSEDSLAMARSSRTKLDRDPATWQRLATELRLPAHTDYLVIRLHITQSFDAGEKPVFTGSYADDVRVSLTTRPPLP